MYGGEGSEDIFMAEAHREFLRVETVFNELGTNAFSTLINLTF